MEPERLINPETLVVKKDENFLKATGMTEEILKKTHIKFINKMQELEKKKICPALRFKYFLEDLSVLEQKAVLFYALCDLNTMTNQFAIEQRKKKKIITPGPSKKIITGSK